MFPSSPTAALRRRVCFSPGKASPLVRTIAGLWGLGAVLAASAAAASLSDHAWTSDPGGGEPHTLLLWKFEGDDPGADASGNGHTARFAAAGATTGVPGRFGEGFRSEVTGEDLGGSTANDSFVQGGMSAREVFNGSALSVEFWFRPVSATPGSATGWSYLFDKRYTDPGGISFRFSTETGLRADVHNGARLRFLATGALHWEAGWWYHLAVTYEAESGTLRIFRDGEIVAESVDETFGELADAPSRTWRLANRLGSSYGSVPGDYDNFRVSSVAYDYRGFFQPGPGAPSDLATDRLYPQGTIFPYTGFSGQIQREKENFFTAFGPVYSNYETFLQQAVKHEMPALYPIGIAMNFLEKDGEPPLDLTREEIEAEIREQVEAVMHEETIAWWYLKPEELRHWRTREMEYLEVAARTIRDTDPLNRLVWMYEPNHRTAGEMAKIAPHLGVVGKGMYTNHVSQRDHRVWCRWTIEAQKEAIAMANPSAIPIAVPEMFQQPPEELLHRIPEWVRHDVYLSLISGAKGVVIFSLANRANFPAHEAYYQAYADIARELNGELDLGQVFLFGERRSDLTIEVVEGPEIVMPKVGSGGISEEIPYPAVASLDVAHASGRYLFLANSAEEPVSLSVGGMPEEGTVLQDLFGAGHEVALDGALTLDLAPLEVRGYLLRPPGRYSDWTARHFDSQDLQDPAVAGPDADPSGRGVPNLLSYALGLNPWAPDPRALPRFYLEEGAETRPAFHLNRRLEAADLSFELEASSDLTTWSPLPLEWETLDQSGLHQEGILRGPETGGERQFFRLRLRREP